MAWQFRILVVANVTADSPELIAALTERGGPSALLVHAARARPRGRARGA